MGREKKFKKSSVFTLMLLTLSSRILGLLREVVKAKYIGAGGLNDAFNVAFMIPNLLRRLFAESSMTAAFIPTFKGYLKEDNECETKKFLNSLFTTLTFLVSTTVIIGIITTPILVKVFNEKNADIPEVIFLTRIMFPYLAFISLAALFQGVLNCLNIFGPGGFVPVLFNIIVILSTMFLSRFTQNHARAMAIGVSLGGFIQMSFQLPYILKNGFTFKLTGIKKAFKDPGTKKVGRLIAPTLAGMGAYQLSIAVANVVAIDTGRGVSSSLNYSLRLQELVLGVFAVSIGTVLISTLSKDAKDLNWKNFSESLKLSLNVISLITIPVTIFAFIHSTEIVEIVYKRGAFDEAGLIMTSGVFRFHIAGLLFIAITRIIGPAFYSLEDSKTPAILGSISVGIGILLMFILAPLLKANGLALAITVSSVIQMILYFIFLSKKKDIEFTRVLKSVIPGFFRVGLYSSISAVPIIFFKDNFFRLFTFSSPILRIGFPLIISTLLFFSIYGFILVITRERSVKELFKVARRKK